VRGELYATAVVCEVVCCMEVRPIRKKNEVELQQAEMRMVRWMCGIKLQVNG